MIFFVSTTFFFIQILRSPKHLLLALVSVVIIYFSCIIQKQQFVNNLISGEFKVVSVTSVGPVIKSNGMNVLINTSVEYNLGDVLKIEGVVSKVQNNDLNFDKESWLKSLNIINWIERPTDSIVSRSNEIRNSISKYLTTGGTNFTKLAPLLTIGEKTSETSEMYKIAARMNVVHLFVISGFHLSLFNTIVNKSLLKIKIKEEYASLLSLLPIILYLYILNFPTSATRALLLLVFNHINKYYLKNKFSIFDRLSIVLIVMIAYKPYSVTSLSFIYSFVATYFVVFFSQVKLKNPKNQIWLIAVGVYMGTLPISIYVNNYFSITGLLFSIALTPVFVLGYIGTLILLPFKNILETLYIPFIYIMSAFDRINIIINVNPIPLVYVQSLYLIISSCFIINKEWYLYTVVTLRESMNKLRR